MIAHTLRTIAIGLLAAPLAAASPPPQAGEGVADLLARALSASPAIGNATALQVAADRSMVDAMLGFAPRASWTFDNSNERLNVKRSSSSIYHVGVSSFSNYGQALQVVQPVLDPRLFAQLHGSRFTAKRSRAELDATRQRVIFELIQAYLITLGAADALVVSRAEEASLALQQEQMKLRVERGIASQVDLDEVTSRLMQSRAQRQAAATTLTQSFATLEHRVSGSVNAVLPLGGPLPMPPPVPADVQSWVSEARERNPEIVALVNAAGEAWATFEAQGAALAPRLEFTYTANRSETGGSVYGGGSLTADQTWLLRLTVPLFNADGAGYPVYAAHARARAARYRTEDQRQEVEERVRTAYDEIIGNSTRAEDVARAATAQERVVQAKRDRYTAGLIRITEVLDAERDLYQVRRMLLASRYNYLLNLIQLKRLAGDISAGDAEFIDTVLVRNGPVVTRTGSDPAMSPSAADQARLPAKALVSSTNPPARPASSQR